MPTRMWSWYDSDVAIGGVLTDTRWQIYADFLCKFVGRYAVHSEGRIRPTHSRRKVGTRWYPEDHSNAMRHGLRNGAGPFGCSYVTKQDGEFRSSQEAMVMAGQSDRRFRVELNPHGSEFG